MIRPLLSILMLATLAACTSCGPAAGGAVIASRVMGPSKVPARYNPPAGTVLVLVENYRSPDAAALNADQLGRYITENLKANIKGDKDQPSPVQYVDATALYDLRSNRPSEYRKLKISEIGQTLGADQIIYVDLQYAGVQSTLGSDLLRAALGARVKVIDARTGVTVWPVDSAQGYPVAYESKPQRPGDQVYPEAIREEALREGAKRIARLFYTWKPVDEKEAMEG